MLKTYWFSPLMIFRLQSVLNLLLCCREILQCIKVIGVCLESIQEFNTQRYTYILNVPEALCSADNSYLLCFTLEDLSFLPQLPTIALFSSLLYLFVRYDYLTVKTCSCSFSYVLNVVRLVSLFGGAQLYLCDVPCVLQVRPQRYIGACRN